MMISEGGNPRPIIHTEVLKMGNCLCGAFDDNNLCWILIIALVIIFCCCSGNN